MGAGRGVQNPARNSGVGSCTCSVALTISEGVWVVVASGMLITRPEFTCEIVLLHTEGCCCRYTAAPIREMKGKLLCNNRVRCM